MVFLHGFGLDHRIWENQVSVLQEHFTVISYDVRGFGQSILPDGLPYAHEDDYKSILHRFGFDRAHVVGSSMGGRMALRCALNCPDAVSSLILLDSALDGYGWSIDWQNEWLPIVLAARDGELATARELWADHSLFVPANKNSALRAGLSTIIGQYSGWHWINKDPAVVPQPAALHRLRDIVQPTLVVSGEYDIPDFHEIAGILSDGIPRARKLLVPGSGHMVNIEAPDMVNREIIEFISSIDR